VALYYFVLKTAKHTLPDVEGEEFNDQVAARNHAIAVAQELMHNREIDTRLWRIEIRDEYLQLSSEVFFSSIDPTIGHLPAHMRESFELIARKSAGLADAMGAIRATMVDVQDTLARADRFLNLLPRDNK
jgi:hypothetical protein